MAHPYSRSVIALVLWAAASLPLSADDWPHWRGPQRNDHSHESSGYDGGEWLTGDAAWNVNVGQGCNALVAVDGRLYAQGWRDEQDTVRCLDAATGRELWSQSYPCPRYGRRATGDEGVYAGPSSTPEFDGETQLLYTLSTDGDLNCWDTGKRGQRRWGMNLYERFDTPRRPRHGRSGLRDYGYTTAPLVHGEWVIVEVGDDEGTLMAWDKRSGKRAWVSECRDPAGHAGGLSPIEVEGIPCVAALTYKGLLVTRLDAGNAGRTVAQYEWTTDFANNIATPAVDGASVLITSEYNRAAICRLDISLDGARKVWEQPYSSKVCSPLIYEGHVYWAWRRVHCLDFATGEERFSGGEFGDAGSCIVTRDGKLIVWGQRGKLALVQTAGQSPGEYRELAVRDGIFATDAWPHVVLSAGRLYCKDREGNLKCFVLPGASAAGG